MNDELFARALSDLGVHEEPGRGTHPRIERAMGLIPPWIDRDDSETSWCGIMLGLWCFEVGAGLPPRHYRAREWKAWGEAVQTPRRGHVVAWENHVGLVDRIEGGRVWTLGGNQSNAVTIAPYSCKSAVFRRAVMPKKHKTNALG